MYHKECTVLCKESILQAANVSASMLQPGNERESANCMLGRLLQSCGYALFVTSMCELIVSSPVQQE